MFVCRLDCYLNLAKVKTFSRMDKAVFWPCSNDSRENGLVHFNSNYLPFMVWSWNSKWKTAEVTSSTCRDRNNIHPLLLSHFMLPSLRWFGWKNGKCVLNRYVELFQFSSNYQWMKYQYEFPVDTAQGDGTVQYLPDQIVIYGIFHCCISHFFWIHIAYSYCSL